MLTRLATNLAANIGQQLGNNFINSNSNLVNKFNSFNFLETIISGGEVEL
ncbi:MAG: hypothetical protein AB8U20_02660 [Rickettsiales endosymbiont of Dermacentor nuttalli]